MIDFLRLVFLFTSLKKINKRLKLSRDTYNAFFSDTYSGLFSLMVDKSNSNGSDKGTLMFYTLSGNYSQAVLNVHCKKCLCYQVFSRLSESYSSSKKLNCFMHFKKEISKGLAQIAQCCDEIISCTQHIPSWT